MESIGCIENGLLPFNVSNGSLGFGSGVENIPLNT
jgi:hypothetical protein